MSIAIAEFIDASTEYSKERNKPMPSKNHALIQMLLGYLILKNCFEKYTVYSELKLELFEKPDLVPDLCVYPKQEKDFHNDTLAMKEMPLIAIEIMSPSQSNEEILANIGRYFQAGVKSCWMVIPPLEAVIVYSTIHQYSFYSSSQVLKDSVFGIEVDLHEVFK